MVTRLTDPPQTGGRQNLVLERLKELAGEGDECLSQDVDAALASAKTACDVLREHRNKRLAHLDLSASLDTSLLTPFSREVIETALAKVREVLNKLNIHFRHGPTMYENVSMRGDAQCLIECIEDGLKFRLRDLRLAHGLTFSCDRIAQGLAGDKRLECGAALSSGAGC